jgi:hypothetical protein
MGVHAFVDETSERGLLVVVAVLAERDLTEARSTMRRLCLPAQSRLHFAKESHGRRGTIVTAMCRTGAVLDVYDATRIHNARAARAACLRQLVLDLADERVHRLVIEQADAFLHRDQEVLFSAARGAGVSEFLVYEHRRARSEPLLWIADAAAWCWTHGEEWRRRNEPVVRRVTVV